MIVYVLTFIVSLIIAILFLKIKLKEDLRLLIVSYANSTNIVLHSKSDDQQEELFRELKNQFKLLFMMMAKLVMILSPCLIIIIYTIYSKTPIIKFVDFTSFLISIAAFLTMYIYSRYAKPQ
jgi:nicotinamide riboside transporter PnuC